MRRGEPGNTLSVANRVLTTSSYLNFRTNEHSPLLSYVA